MPKPNWMYLTCEECWKVFYRDKSHIRKRYFCSPECLSKSRNKKYQPWTKYWHLTIIWFVEWVKKHWFRVLECECDCWNKTEVTTWMWGIIKSCWCRRWFVHWKSRTPEYSSWNWMYNRCNWEEDPAYKWYWGRGIKVLYKDFEEFYNDVWPRPWPWYSIDRIDANWNYEPWNCRWATTKEQANNTRKNVWFKMWEEIHTVSERADILKVSHTRAKKYLLKHWERIFKY